MTECPRNFERDEMIRIFRGGGVLRLDRSDAPERKELEKMERDGFLVSRLVQVDPQYSYREYRMAPHATGSDYE